MRLPDFKSRAFWRGILIGVAIYGVTRLAYDLLYK